MPNAFDRFLANVLNPGDTMSRGNLNRLRGIGEPRQNGLLASAAPPAAGGLLSDVGPVPQTPQQEVPQTDTRAFGYQASPAPNSQLQSRPGDGIGGLLSNLLDPEGAARNQTVSWLRQDGLDEGTAILLAGNKPALQQYLLAKSRGVDPKDTLQLEKLRLEIDQMRNPTTDDVREYQFARQQGYEGSFTDFMQEMRQAGATNINNQIDLKGETEYAKTVGKGYGDRFLSIQDEAQAAQRALNALDVMEQSMADPGFYSGAASGSVTALKRYAASLGLPGAEGIESMENFNALAKQAALDVMGGSLGTGFSNADRDFVLDQVPNLQNTPQGNIQLIEIQRKLNTRKQRIAQLARQYAEDNNGRIDAGFDGFLARWAERNPLFPKTPSGSGRGTGSEAGPTRARNPQTGEVIEWDGQRWRPVR